MFSQNELNQLYRFALSISRHEQVAYDLLQSALERYCQKTQASRAEIDNPAAYLKAIIRNLYIDLQRHQKCVPMVSIESEDLATIEPVDNRFMEDVLINQQEIEHLLQQLNNEENELLYLWAVEEYTVDEISTMYEKPRGTILSRLHRLKKRIKEHANLLEAEHRHIHLGGNNG